MVFADFLLVFCLVSILYCHLLWQYTRKAILANFYMLGTNNPLHFPLRMTMQWTPLNLIWIALSFAGFMKHVKYHQSSGLQLKCFWQGLFCETARKLIQNFSFIESLPYRTEILWICLDDVRIMFVLVLCYCKGAVKPAEIRFLLLLL